MSGIDDTSLPAIKDVVIGETIGQGAFACVKNAYLKVDPSVVIAVKFVHIPTCKQFGLTEKDVVGEIILHSKCCNHANILRVIDCNITRDHLWIAMEMADGGDLFDKIEPDVGVDYEVAQFYFQQLVNAITYLHLECHIAHRDIKPENILLDKNGNLKLADFGLASRFKRRDGTLRLSSDQRGSPQYMAPEVLMGVKYHPEKTDVWSVGVLVFVLLTGEVPWELPIRTDENFEEFIRNEGNITMGRWASIEFRHLNLLRKILQPDPSKRATIQDLRKHPWFLNQLSFANSEGLCSNPALLAKKLFSNLRVSLSDDEYMRFTQDPLTGTGQSIDFRATQPADSDYAGLQHDTLNLDAVGCTQKPYTQNTTELLRNDLTTSQSSRWTRFINTDIAALQFCHKNNPSFASQFRFNPIRLTKFYSVQEMEVILPLFEQALRFAKINIKPDLLSDFLNLKSSLGYEGVFPLVINIRTQDARGSKLNGVIIIKIVRENLKSISFERKAGDPLDWRRLFKKVALFCREVILVPD
ncbi:hypothetical protein HG536_0F02180 [Torulaspora globosa]|uniref:non-specific serine/threonine protein kinase n=1 Tax=Torulaspora globosa TaxID=48254 RepID=A0A7G3ZK57_9SACH|nr:uncharacterized protein HG536_0F02180 [Torulaspora globosa]QLL33893.1 hypothetical protein HG536_0F02180 [Torulaspora globosa]